MTEEAYMENDKRCEDKRLEIARPVELVDLNSEESDGQIGYTKNLSNRGMRARFDKPPSLGEIVRLEVTLIGDEPPVITLGKVIWSRPDKLDDGVEVGIEFLENEAASNTSDDDTYKNDYEHADIQVFKPGREVKVDVGGRTVAGIIEYVERDDASLETVVQINFTRDALTKKNEPASRSKGTGGGFKSRKLVIAATVAAFVTNALLHLKRVRTSNGSTSRIKGIITKTKKIFNWPKKRVLSAKENIVNIISTCRSRLTAFK